jgi:hypothetical protein
MTLAHGVATLVTHRALNPMGRWQHLGVGWLGDPVWDDYVPGPRGELRGKGKMDKVGPGPIGKRREKE